MILTKEQFKDAAREIVEVFNKYCQNKKENQYTFLEKEKLNQLKEYIVNNKDSNEVINFQNAIIDYVVTNILNDEFLSILNNDDTLKYEQILLIKENLPLSCNFEKDIIRDLVGIPNNTLRYDNFIKECIDHFLNEEAKIKHKKTINKFYDFLDNNLALIRKIHDEYPKDIDEAYFKYYKAVNNIFDQDFEEFKKTLSLEDYQQLSDYEKKNKYIRKLLGYLGEMYYFEAIKNQLNAKFIAKEYGNGYGYDIYFQTLENNKLVENLIEVKSTTKQNPYERISLTENEYNVMNSVDYQNSNYYIARVIVDSYNKNSYELYLLKYIGDNTFQSISDYSEYHIMKKSSEEYEIDLSKTKDKVSTKSLKK